MQVVSTGIPLVRLPQGVERKMNYKARFILEHCGGFTKRQYNLYLSVNTDDEFIAELKRLPVFTYVRDDRESCSKLFVSVNPVIGVKSAERQIRTLVKALAERQR